MYTKTIIMSCNAMQCNAMQCNAMQCNAMQCYAMLCYAMLCYAMPSHAMQRNAMPLVNAMPCHANAMPCHAMPCHAMPCHAMPCRAMPCYTILFLVVPVKFRIHFKICTITFRILEDNQPAYLADLLVRPTCSKYLSSTNSNKFAVPRIKTKTGSRDSYICNYICPSLMERSACVSCAS